MSEPGDRLAGRDMPVLDTSNPANLEAWFGNFGYDERLRKVLLGNCKEIVRARYTLANEKVSEARIDDLAHLHDSYLDFLVASLKGREAREDNVIASLTAGA